MVDLDYFRLFRGGVGGGRSDVVRVLRGFHGAIDPRIRGAPGLGYGSSRCI